MRPEHRPGGDPAGRWPALRIGDREREAAAASLAEQYAQGRLDTDEHAERLDAIWSARTQADLDQLFWDLPTGPAAQGGTPAPRTPAVARRRRPMLWLVVALVVLSVVTEFPFWIFAVALWVGAVKRRHGGCAGRGGHAMAGAHPTWR